jgi:hypothetical protein
MATTGHGSSPTPRPVGGNLRGALNAALVASRPQSTGTASAPGRVWRERQREDVSRSASARWSAVCAAGATTSCPIAACAGLRRAGGVRIVNPITPRPHQRQVVDDVVQAYVEWREESAAVWDTYDRWASASAADKRPADSAYRAALDREAAAAKSYAELIEVARDRLDTASELSPLPRGSD